MISQILNASINKYTAGKIRREVAQGPQGANRGWEATPANDTTPQDTTDVAPLQRVQRPLQRTRVPVTALPIVVVFVFVHVLL